jgi:hypothetical protein
MTIRSAGLAFSGDPMEPGTGWVPRAVALN